jgi:hypothetical protein
VVDTIEQVLDQYVQDIDDIVLGGGFQVVGERQQGGNPAGFGHPSDSLSACSCRVASQHFEPAQRQAREVYTPGAKRTHFVKSV